MLQHLVQAFPSILLANVGLLPPGVFELLLYAMPLIIVLYGFFVCPAGHEARRHSGGMYGSNGAVEPRTTAAERGIETKTGNSGGINGVKQKEVSSSPPAEWQAVGCPRFLLVRLAPHVPRRPLPFRQNPG